MEKELQPKRQEQRSQANSQDHEAMHSNAFSLQPPSLQLKADPIQKMGEEEEELQMKVNPIQKMGEEEEEMQMKINPIQKMGEEEEEEMQMKAGPFQLKKQSTIQRSSAGGGNNLPEGVQSKMEGAMQTDFSNVNIHSNSSKATDVGALAYTQGNDIHFAPGQYNPTSSAGQELIGHELAHVVQQREGRVQPTTQIGGMPVNDDKGLESEADRLGRKASQFKEE